MCSMVIGTQIYSVADFALKTAAVVASAGTMAAATAAAPNPMAAAKAKFEIAGTAASHAGVISSTSTAIQSTSAYATMASYGARFVDSASDTASALASSSVGQAVSSAASSAGSAAANGASYVGSGLWNGASWVASGTYNGAAAAGRWVGTKLGLLDELDDLVGDGIPTWLFDATVDTPVPAWYDPIIDTALGMPSYMASACSSMYDEWVNTMLLKYNIMFDPGVKAQYIKSVQTKIALKIRGFSFKVNDRMAYLGSDTANNRMTTEEWVNVGLSGASLALAVAGNFDPLGVTGMIASFV